MVLPQHIPELGEHGADVTLVLTQPLVDIGADEILEHLTLSLLSHRGYFSVAFLLKLRPHRRADPVVPLLPRRGALLGITLLLVVANVVFDLIQRHLARDRGRYPRARGASVAHHRTEHVVNHRRFMYRFILAAGHRRRTEQPVEFVPERHGTTRGFLRRRPDPEEILQRTPHRARGNFCGGRLRRRPGSRRQEVVESGEPVHDRFRVRHRRQPRRPRTLRPRPLDRPLEVSRAVRLAPAQRVGAIQ